MNEHSAQQDQDNERGVAKSSISFPAGTAENKQKPLT